MESQKDAKQGLKKYWPAFVGVGVILLAVLFYVVQHNSVVNAGNKKQQSLITRYNETTNVLSDCIVKTKAAVGVANAQTGALDEVISDAVKGRYTAGSTAKPGSSNALFSALREAYPDTSGLSETFQNVQIIINGCRSDFRDSQAELQKAVARFNEWRTGSFTTRTFGGGDYPNDELAIKVSGKVVTGQEALTQMRELVVVEEAQQGRDTGEIEAENPFEPSN